MSIACKQYRNLVTEIFNKYDNIERIGKTRIVNVDKKIDNQYLIIKMMTEKN